MLLNIRQSSAIKISKFFFGLICALMILTPIMSAFQSSSYNPVILKSPSHKIKIQDIFHSDRNFMSFLASLSSDRKDVAELAIQQHFRALSYQDFFDAHGAVLSDQLAWEMFLGQMDSAMSAEQYASLDQTIKQRFGSRKIFLEKMKTQLIAQNLQESLVNLTAPVVFEDSPFALPLEYRIKQYNFSPRDYMAQIPFPDLDRMQEYFQNHSQRYIQQSHLDLHAVFIEPAGIDLNQIHPDIQASAKAELESMGYADIQDVLIQKIIFNDLLEQLQERELYSLEQAEQITSCIQASERRALSKATKEQVNALLAAEGLFEMMERESLDGSMPSIALVPFEGGVWMVSASHYAPSTVPSYESVATQVYQDWKEETAGILAQNAAEQFIKDYKANPDLFLGKPSQDYISDNLLEDRRFDNALHISLSQLCAKNINHQGSIVGVHDGDLSSGIKVYILENVQFKEGMNDDLLSEEIRQSERSEHFNLPDYAHASATLSVFNNAVDHQYGYTIEPAFWTLLERIEKNTAQG